ncbi:hypothetical protein FDECE_18035 [Fusarium decemcellulare]|nr:hypothetical protein FDECE_18035 [Fusarium decemcellulare]
MESLGKAGGPGQRSGTGGAVQAIHDGILCGDPAFPAPSGLERRKLGPGPEGAPPEAAPYPHAASEGAMTANPQGFSSSQMPSKKRHHDEIEQNHPCSVQNPSTHP